MTGTDKRRSFQVGPERVAGERLWAATFEPSDKWLIERQKPGSSVSFDGNRMHIDAIDERGVTIWTQREFPADLLVEYEATPAEPEGVLSSRNLNCFLCAADDEPLDETERSGAYPDYHDFPNYIFTLTRTHSRLRRDPGFEQASEIMLGVQPDETYTIQLLKRGDRLTACVNGRVLHDWRDPDPHGAGWVGLRTYDTDITYDSWSVYGIENE